MPLLNVTRVRPVPADAKQDHRTCSSETVKTRLAALLFAGAFLSTCSVHRVPVDDSDGADAEIPVIVRVFSHFDGELLAPLRAPIAGAEVRALVAGPTVRDANSKTPSRVILIMRSRSWRRRERVRRPTVTRMEPAGSRCFSSMRCGNVCGTCPMTPTATGSSTEGGDGLRAAEGERSLRAAEGLGGKREGPEPAGLAAAGSVVGRSDTIIHRELHDAARTGRIDGGLQRRGASGINLKLKMYR